MGIEKKDWNFVVYGIGTETEASGYVAADGARAGDCMIAGGAKDEASGTIKYSTGYVLTKLDGITPIATVSPTVEDLGENDFVRIWTWNGKGKIVPKESDGLAFYYTTINPQATNFTLSANLHVNNWRIGNGQEGFGLLAADRIGKNGDARFHWTNSYAAVVSKIDYKWDSVKGKVSPYGDTDICLRLGIGSTAKTGVTAENISLFDNDSVTAMKKYYKAETLPLDTSVHTKIYDNLIGNENLGTTKSIPNPIEDLRLAIELNATGYFISYTPLTKNADGTFTEGETVTNKYYNRNALSMCEEDTVYIGFFATRHADVTFRDVKLDTKPYDPDEEPESRPVEEVDLQAGFLGVTTANSEDYNLGYGANWKGVVTVKDETGNVLGEKAIEPGDGYPVEKCSIRLPLKLQVGTNKFQVTFIPDQNYDPYKGEPSARLTSYDSKTDTVTVTWKQYGKVGEAIYVSPDGKDSGDGTKAAPLDIYTAVKYAQPGQTVYLIGGTYRLDKTVRIEKGVNGMKDKMIYLLADPETCTKENGIRPIFDYGSQCTGMIIEGDWWYCKGFDVTRSANRTNGIRISGHHNVMEGINVYKNGNTGLQISIPLDSDKYKNEWPSYNLILNCTSFLNTDSGYTDADGFAAKITVGAGNIFDGCISAYNADDGFDLFTKVKTGPIGTVTIRNCISFENGRVIRDKKTNELVWFDESDDYEIVNAGCGNGFKMGGSSITGYHVLENCVAFRNKLKGIDCNSCPDIQVYNSISFDNESHNVAMYSDAAKTDFKAVGVISYRSEVGLDIEDYIGHKQEDCVEKIFNNTNFLWNKSTKVSEPGEEFYKHFTLWTDENSKPPQASVTVSDDWFENISYDEWIAAYCKRHSSIGRDMNGKVNLHGFLELSEKGRTFLTNLGNYGKI